MEWMLFDHAKYDKMYNCSFLSYEEWASLGHVSIPMGIIYIVVGLIYIPIYIALLIVMLRPEFIQHSCYKIMFYLGIIDIIAVFDSAIISGYLSLVGAVFCTHPALTYIGGGLGLGCWCSTCATVLLLAFNRLIDLAMPHLSDSIFHGKCIFAWLAIPICYGLYYWWFSCPCLYNSNFYACFLDPYFGLSIDHQTDVVYANFLFSINNIAIIVALGTFYIAIICALIAKTRFANIKSVSTIQRQTIIQAALICFLIFVASAIYVYMQFFPTPTILIIVAQFFWQASHGGSAFIYLIFNKSMRRATLQMIFRTKTETKVVIGQRSGWLDDARWSWTPDFASKYRSKLPLKTGAWREMENARYRSYGCLNK